MGEDIKENLEAIWAVVQKQAEAHNKLLKVVAVISTILCPLIIGFLMNKESDWFEGHSIRFLVVILLPVIVQIVSGVFLILSSETTYDIFVRARRIRDECDSLSAQLEVADQDLKQQTFLATYAYTWINQLPIFSRNLVEDASSLSDAVFDIFAPILTDEDAFLELAPKEHVKFMLYLFDEDTKELRPVWKQEIASGRKLDEKKSRCWAPGEGHVGLAFSKKETICTADATTEEMKGIFAAPTAKQLETDEAMYKSFISVPLDRQDNEPYGVLVATSNRKNRFDEQNGAPFVLAAAATIEAVLFAGDLDRIVAENGAV